MRNHSILPPLQIERKSLSGLFMALVTVFAMLLMTGCRGDKGVDPDILDQPAMMAVLADVAKAEEYTTQLAGRDSTLVYNRELMRQYKRVFAKHQINRQRFFKSVNYYLSKPYLAKDMFDSLQAQIRRNAYDRMPAQINN